MLQDSILPVSSFPPGADAEWFFVAVGARLVRYELRADGRLRELDALLMPCNVQYACWDSLRSLLYVACSNGGVRSRGDVHCLMCVQVDAMLQQRGSRMALRHRPIHVSLDRLGQRLLVAYNLPAAVSVHRLDPSGVPGDVQFADAQPSVGWFPHQILPLPHGDGLLLTCRGDDATVEDAEHPGSLRLLRCDEKEGFQVRQVVAPGGGFGFGPRNCAFHPIQPWLYAVLERQNALALFHLDAGRVAAEPSWIVGLLERPHDVRSPQLGGAIVLHPGGRFAYVVNRAHGVTSFAGREVDAGGENSIAVFSLDRSTGEPVLVQSTPLRGQHARCVALAHGGTLLLAAIRQDSAHRMDGDVIDRHAGVSVFRIAADGRLEAMAHHCVVVGRDQLFWAGSAR